MPPFHLDAFAHQVVAHLEAVNHDRQILMNLTEEQQKAVFTKIINIKVNLPLLNERMEAMAFAVAIELAFNLIKSQFGKKEMLCAKCGEAIK